MLNVEKELVLLRTMTVPQLQRKYAEVHGGEPSRSHHKQFLVRKIIWRMQALEEGDLSERARRRAAELANDADLRTRSPAKRAAPGIDSPVLARITPEMTVAARAEARADDRLPMPGSVLTRTYRGQRYEVAVTTDGFIYVGERFRSLSAVAKAITGSHWNGWLFFGLTVPREAH